MLTVLRLRLLLLVVAVVLLIRIVADDVRPTVDGSRLPRAVYY